jgi:hypothetical protein
MPFCLIEDLTRSLCTSKSLDQDTLAGSAGVKTLLDALMLVPDPRRRQGCLGPARRTIRRSTDRRITAPAIRSLPTIGAVDQFIDSPTSSAALS